MSDEQQVSAEVKKSRRQTAFYPVVTQTSNTKPFSKSAAKRESVLALGSIEHLQYYFTKAGLAAKQRPEFKAKGLVPAIGGGHLRTPSALNGIPELRFELPPTPVVPQATGQPFANPVKSYTDPEELLPSLVGDLERVSSLWGLGSAEQRRASSPPNGAPASGDQTASAATSTNHETFDVLLVLQSTINAIKSVRNYLVALPDDTDTTLTVPTFRPQTISRLPNPVAKPARRKEGPRELLTLIRRPALNVLTALQEIEEKYRLPMTEDPFDGTSDQGSGSTRSTLSPHATSGEDDASSTASFNFSTVVIPGRNKTITVWEDEEEDVFNDDVETERKERWDEKLVLGGGWLYRSDVSLSEVETTRQLVAEYLDKVDSVVFSGNNAEEERGWTRSLYKLRSNRRSSSRSSSGRQSPDLNPNTTSERRPRSGLIENMQHMTIQEDTLLEEPSSPNEADDEYLPNWAKRTEFVDDPLGRALALLVTLLPVELLHLLPPPSEPLTSTSLMNSLSSGQLLCVAYNAGVRKSRKPWGYINTAAIHDIASLEGSISPNGDKEDEKGGKPKVWTFRRTENLRLWAAALKLRYMIPLVTPSQLLGNKDNSRANTPATSPTHTNFSLGQVGGPNLFDPGIVARREQLWEEMLHDAVLLWMDAVVKEKREDV
ncbi:hypothetical protein CPB86DRAFT_725534 [Serendipita vermifera]|nr:hypothetical protein CPB86DRAFT_725534 [Serendipita vermifera]